MYSDYICIIYMMTVDALYFMLVTHVCINFMVLYDDFQNLKNSNFANLNKCIQNHQTIIELSEHLDAIFRLPNFFNILVGSFEICALGFCITVGKWSDLPGYFLFLSTVLAQIWMISIFGDNIISKSSEINDAVWKCYWNSTDAKTQRIFLLIMLRSQKPQKLTAYMSTICCSSFMKILNNSWSYFSILRSVYKPPEISNG
ncbi:putative odorant receptor 92a [Ostrinia nubilalis]|uniref:putative odorant receptor 92a n=1 Tax=Ostrinia nubilalis TaxID=29057 RepID=UPI00308251A2